MWLKSRDFQRATAPVTALAALRADASLGERPLRDDPGATDPGATYAGARTQARLNPNGSPRARVPAPACAPRACAQVAGDGISHIAQVGREARARRAQAALLERGERDDDVASIRKRRVSSKRRGSCGSVAAATTIQRLSADSYLRRIRRLCSARSASGGRGTRGSDPSPGPARRGSPGPAARSALRPAPAAWRPTGWLRARRAVHRGARRPRRGGTRRWRRPAPLSSRSGSGRPTCSRCCAARLISRSDTPSMPRSANSCSAAKISCFRVSRFRTD